MVVEKELKRIHKREGFNKLDSVRNERKIETKMVIVVRNFWFEKSIYTLEQIAECVEKTIEEVEAVIRKREPVLA